MHVAVQRNRYPSITVVKHVLLLLILLNLPQGYYEQCVFKTIRTNLTVKLSKK